MSFLKNILHEGGPVILFLVFVSCLVWYWVLTIHFALRKSEVPINLFLKDRDSSFFQSQFSGLTDLIKLVRIETLFLKSLAQISLFLGLLGTVIGILNSMGSLNITGTLSDLFSREIARALFTTGAGICAALPAVFAIPVFNRRCDKITLFYKTLKEV